MLGIEAGLRARMWYEMTQHGGAPLYNFGDELSSLAIREATGRRAVWTPIHNADVIGIGSILHLYRDTGCQGYIWGSGIQFDPDSYAAMSGEKVLALRGEKTRAAITGAEHAPLGDPGLLARSIFGRHSRNRLGPRASSIIIPHITVFSTRAGRQLLAEFGKHVGKIVPPSTPIAEIATEISRARHVYSSSLHGIIVAHALGTPATHIEFSATPLDEFKYDDYFGSLNLQRTSIPAIDILKKTNREAAFKNADAQLSFADTTIDSLVQGLYLSARPLV